MTQLSLFDLIEKPKRRQREIVGRGEWRVLHWGKTNNLASDHYRGVLSRKARESFPKDLVSKICPDCQQEYPIKVFMAHGVHKWMVCKKCRRKVKYLTEAQRQAYAEHVHKWQREHPERVRASVEAYRNANPERVRERQRETSRKRRAANREEYNKKHQAWVESNRERVREIGAAWTKQNRASVNIKNHRRRTRRSGAGGRYTLKEWQELKALCDHLCLCCGLKAHLTADHIIPVLDGGPSFIWNIQPLCKSCNSSKHARTIDYRSEKVRMHYAELENEAKWRERSSATEC